MPRPKRVEDRPLADRLGCTHAAGRYSFTDQDFLNEGADQILALGMRVIKVYLHQPAKLYRFNSDWPDLVDPVEIAKHAYYRALFTKPFTTYILTTYAGPESIHYWRRGVTDEQAARETEAFRGLARYFLETYRGTGKTFVFQHWEGDWALREATNLSPQFDPDPPAIDGMIRWLNARQEGVDRARREVPDSDVRVYHACEVNLVGLAMDGRPTVTNSVVPHTRCDLYSYSAYDTSGRAADDAAAGRARFRAALDYLAAKAPDSPEFGDRNIYIGEFGHPQVQSQRDPGVTLERHGRVVRSAVETALEWGCPYVVYWQIYCNESRAGRRRPDNSEVRGYYLIRPDGTRSPTWDYFAALLAPDR